jgi:pyruvate formate lyase activating enzyme
VRLVIFVQGCHFRCLYCHNPDTWALKGGTLIEVDELIQKALLQKPFFGIRGGVTVSGGEPLVQRKALSEFFKKLHMQGVHTVLDTNGHTIDEDAQDLLRHTDLVLLDVKQIHNEKHKKLTGRPVDEVLQFARYCEDHNVHMWLRYVLVPGVNDDAQDLTQWAKYFHGWKQVERVEILPYHTYGAHKYESMGITYPLAGIKAPTLPQIQIAREIFSTYLKNVYVR